MQHLLQAKLKKMAKILKFVYNVILFVSLYLLVIYAESKLFLILFYLKQILSLIFSNILFIFFYITEECDTDADCQKKFPGANQHLVWCNNGYCECHTH